MKKFFGFSMVLVGIVLFVFSISEWGFRFGWIKAKPVRKTISIQKIKQITVDSAIDLEIYVGKQPELQVVLIDPLFPKHQISVNQVQQQLRVKIAPSIVDFMMQDRPKVRIEVPASYHQHLTLLTKENAWVEGRYATQQWKLNRLSIQANRGETNVNHLALRHFHFQSPTGNLNAKRVTIDDSSIQILSGNLRFDQYTGQLNARIYSGNITAQLLQLTKPIQMSITSGNIRLTLPTAASFQLDALARRGWIQSSFQIKGMMSEHRWKGQHREGNHLLQLQTQSGNIMLNQLKRSSRP